MSKNSEEELFITTKDNPFDPFTEFDDWYRFDTDHHYNSCCYLDRISQLPHGLSDAQVNSEINRAVKEIARFNLTGNYVIVRSSQSKKPQAEPSTSEEEKKPTDSDFRAPEGGPQ